MNSGNSSTPVTKTLQNTAVPPPSYPTTPMVATPGGAFSAASSPAIGNPGIGARIPASLRAAAGAPTTTSYDANDMGALASLGFAPGFAQDPTWIHTLGRNLTQAYPQWGSSTTQRHVTYAMPSIAGTTMPNPIGNFTGMSTTLPCLWYLLCRMRGRCRRCRATNQGCMKRLLHRPLLLPLPDKPARPSCPNLDDSLLDRSCQRTVGWPSTQRIESCS